MRQLTFKEYKDKVKGCWTGKNIGGVLGAPFECFRQVNNVEFYTQDLSMGPPPNDDLDLQIIWLAAVEKYGRNVNASLLGEYWLSFIIPNWVEYGMAKANLRAGLCPPLSGYVDNTYGNSCGSFIRSEIWACLAPGHPDIAARYAFEDAIVDHTEEGALGEVFCAALQSAAFVKSDPWKLIEIALSYIPRNSALARAVLKACECYENGIDLLDARRLIHNTAPGTFGIQGIKLAEIQEENNEGMELGRPGFDAPENVAFMIAGWLYGEGDFGRSLVIANSFGEDTDCICATLGALMGIIGGDEAIPEKWKAPLDDKIATLCINNTSKALWIPETASQLTERVIRTMPSFLGQDLCDIFAEGGMTVSCKAGQDLYCEQSDEYMYRMNSFEKNGDLTISQLTELSPYVVRQEFPAMKVFVDYVDSIHFTKGKERKFKVQVYNAFYLKQQQWVKIQVYAPKGVEFVNGSSAVLPLNNLSGTFAEAEFAMNVDEFDGAELELIVDCSLKDRHSCGCVKMKFLRGCGSN